MRSVVLFCHGCRELCGSAKRSCRKIRCTFAGRISVTKAMTLKNTSAAFLAFLEVSCRKSWRTDVRQGRQYLGLTNRTASCDRAIRCAGQSGAFRCDQNDLPALAAEVGLKASMPPEDTGRSLEPFALSDVYTSDIEEACEVAYRRDYVMFGFSTWRILGGLNASALRSAAYAASLVGIGPKLGAKPAITHCTRHHCQRL